MRQGHSNWQLDSSGSRGLTCPLVEVVTSHIRELERIHVDIDTGVPWRVPLARLYEFVLRTKIQSLELPELLKATILRQQVDGMNFDFWLLGLLSCSNALRSIATVEVQLIDIFLISLLWSRCLSIALELLPRPNV